MTDISQYFLHDPRLSLILQKEVWLCCINGWKFALMITLSAPVCVNVRHSMHESSKTWQNEGSSIELPWTSCTEYLSVKYGQKGPMAKGDTITPSLVLQLPTVWCWIIGNETFFSRRRRKWNLARSCKPFGIFPISKSDRKSDRISARQKNSGK